MRMLIITQAVDRKDTVLGFFHGWIEKFAKNLESIEVIALRVGDYDLPKNVHVHALKHDPKQPRMKSIKQFFHPISGLRNQYDVVFVHMNQEYVLLGGLLWKLWGKKIYFWRNHKYGDGLTRIAVNLSNAVFCTSRDSYTACFAKTRIMPAGVDLDIFEKQIDIGQKKNSLLMLGRIAPVKMIEKAIDAVSELKQEGIHVTLSVVGNALPKDEIYLAKLKDRADIKAPGLVDFFPGVSFSETPKLYKSHEIFLNFTPSGSFDKTILEALASGAKVLVSNESMKNLLPVSAYTSGESADMIQKIKILLAFDEAQNAEYGREARITAEKQSLNVLISKLFETFISHV